MTQPPSPVDPPAVRRPARPPHASRARGVRRACLDGAARGPQRAQPPPVLPGPEGRDAGPRGRGPRPARERCSPARRPGSRRSSRIRPRSPMPPAAVARSAARRARTSRNAASTRSSSPGARPRGRRPRGRPPCPRRPCCCAASSWSRVGPPRRTSISTLPGDPELNPTLLFALEASFGVRTDRHALEASAVPPEGEGIEVGLLAARLAEVAAAVPGLRDRGPAPSSATSATRSCRW